jgi:hypothetical protein
MQFGRSFNLLRRQALDHEIVNKARRCVVISENAVTDPADTKPHNIDRASLTPQHPGWHRWRGPKLGIAPFSPR